MILQAPPIIWDSGDGLCRWPSPCPHRCREPPACTEISPNRRPRLSEALPGRVLLQRFANLSARRADVRALAPGSARQSASSSDCRACATKSSRASSRATVLTLSPYRMQTHLAAVASQAGMNPSPAVSIAAVTNTPATTQGIQQALSKVAPKCAAANRSLTPFVGLRDFILKKAEEA